jgi:hypothetical protein
MTAVNFNQLSSVNKQATCSEGNTHTMVPVNWSGVISVGGINSLL